MRTVLSSMTFRPIAYRPAAYEKYDTSAANRQKLREDPQMTQNLPKDARAGISRRSFAAGAAAGGLLAGSAPFRIARAQAGALKVGVLLPRSGAQASIGQDCQRGVEIAPAIFKELNLPELGIMNADTETNVEVARARAEKLINDGAQLLIGAFDSGQSTAIAQVAEQKGIPFVINIAA